METVGSLEGKSQRSEPTTLCPKPTPVSLNLPGDLKFAQWKEIGQALARQPLSAKSGRSGQGGTHCTHSVKVFCAWIDPA